MPVWRQSLRKYILSFRDDVSEPCRNRNLSDYIPRNLPNGVNGNSFEDAAPQASSVNVSGLHISGRSEPVFVPDNPALARFKSGSKLTPSNKAKVPKRREYLLEDAKSRLHNAQSELADSKKKTINPSSWRMTTRQVEIEISQKSAILNTVRSELFKLQCPEIALAMVVPNELTKKRCAKMLAEYNATKGVTQFAAHDLVETAAVVSKRQRSRKNKTRMSKAKEATVPTTGLAGGGSTDNPITID